MFVIPTISYAQEQNREFYQIKIYSLLNDEQVEMTDNYLRKAYLPALKKQNIKNIGVFKPRVDSIKKIYVLIPFSSLSQFETLDYNLEKDKIYLASGADYLKTSHEKPAYQRIESILLKAFVDMPIMLASPLNGERKDRIYELRSYESPSQAYFKNKVDMFNAGGEVNLFKRLGFNAVFYGEVISGPKMPNLMYMTTFANQENRDAHWKEFVDAPEWKELISMSKYDNNVSHIDITFLYPTEYSDY
jgi:hypothetical protein